MAPVAGLGILELAGISARQRPLQVDIRVCCVNVVLVGVRLMSSAATVLVLRIVQLQLPFSGWSIEASPVTIGASFTSVTVMVTYRSIRTSRRGRLPSQLLSNSLSVGVASSKSRCRLGASIDRWPG